MLRLLRKTAATAECALAALRLLRRHPSLLVVPALIAFINVGIRDATHFTYGIESSSGGKTTLTGPTWIPVNPSSWAREQLQTFSAIGDYARPIPTPSLTPVVGAWAVRYAPVREGSPPRVTRLLMAPSILVLLLEITLGAIILAGYYGIASVLVCAGACSRKSFGANVRRYWVRFLQVGLITWALVAWLPLLQFFVSGSDALPNVSTVWLRWVTPVLSFFLALPLYVLVVDGKSALAAISGSVRSVATHLAEMAALLIGFALARALVLWPLLLLSERFDFRRVLAEGESLHSRTALWSASLGSAFLVTTWTTVLGVWLCLAMFFWYRAVIQQPAPATGPASTESAGVLLSGAESRRKLFWLGAAIVCTALIAALIALFANSRSPASPTAGVSAAVEPPVENGEIILLTKGHALGAVVLTRQTTVPERVSYDWYYRTDGRTIFHRDDVRQYHSGHVSDATEISFGPFSVSWSGHDDGSGYLYYQHLPNQSIAADVLRICVTHERDLDQIDAHNPRWLFKGSPSDSGLPLTATPYDSQVQQTEPSHP